MQFLGRTNRFSPPCVGGYRLPQTHFLQQKRGFSVDDIVPLMSPHVLCCTVFRPTFCSVCPSFFVPRFSSHVLFPTHATLQHSLGTGPRTRCGCEKTGHTPNTGLRGPPTTPTTETGPRPPRSTRRCPTMNSDRCDKPGN